MFVANFGGSFYAAMDNYIRPHRQGEGRTQKAGKQTELSASGYAACWLPTDRNVAALWLLSFHVAAPVTQKP